MRRWLERFYEATVVFLLVLPRPSSSSSCAHVNSAWVTLHRSTCYFLHPAHRASAPHIATNYYGIHDECAMVEPNAGAAIMPDVKDDRVMFDKIVATASAIVGQLEQALGADRVSLSDSVRQHHAGDESYHSRSSPDVVVTPSTVEQVSAALSLCNEHRVSVVPFGTGTGLEGGTVASHGGVCLDLMELDRRLDVSVEDFSAVVSASVTRLQLNQQLRDCGLWFPLDPGADASLCGMCATSASGTNAVRYGTMREVVINMQVVLADGTVFHTRGKDKNTKKTSAGYNLTNLFVGSEGTLGVITEATLRLFPYPQEIASAVVSFTDINDCVGAVLDILQCAIPVARLELLDDVQIMACNRYSGMHWPETPHLFLEFHGNGDEIEAQAEFAGQLCGDRGGAEFKWSRLPEEREVLWKARHAALYAAWALKPYGKGQMTDVCVPFSQLPAILTETKRDITESGVIGAIVGHVGDGNFHVTFPADPNDEQEMQNIRDVNDRMIKRALAVGGTCTGEHGIGIGKRKYLPLEMGEATMGAMRRVKTAFDPLGIMNPGKVFFED